MADYFIPKRAAAFTFITSLVSQADGKVFISAPTMATGDFKISKDGGALANLATLPTAVGKTVIVALSASEMTADNIAVVCSDAAGAQWCDQTIHIQTGGYTVTDIGSKTDLITTGSLTIVNPVNAAGTAVTLFRGDDYKFTDSRQLVFTSTSFPVLTGATVLFKISNGTNITGTVTSATSVYFEIPRATTVLLVGDSYSFEVEATLSSGNVATVATGTLTVSGQLT